ncbi:putative lipopolysaccharide beta-1,4-N-acetylgalactosaminyltransferase [Penicillium oxalicum 114-2]|uniref:Putative lipopolysaccharide beta-1,4-N-acetylgalactosaminyltransferase n=1 Tax=Penicillium oxalicum (strain 114-2 / CGMCC 5302) TaxID=933388 RepID=S7ZW06_PENO1|nr:putative lipopolysaccharide beta-1,4-N-acetylgalactosaminyltransferase [Penicillium oxalicum 114-2]
MLSSTKRPWPTVALAFTIVCLLLIWISSHRPGLSHPRPGTDDWKPPSPAQSQPVPPESPPAEYQREDEYKHYAESHPQPSRSPSAKPDARPRPAPEPEQVVEVNVNPAGNATLGFQKIYYISMPHRLDRQDAISLISSLTGLSTTLEPGVNGSLIQQKAKPDGSGILRPEQLGCWRAHANVWKRMLDEDIESAMVIEDDVDWDVHVRDIFTEMSAQLAEQTLFPNLSHAVNSSTAPYGAGWDLLYIGSAWDIPNTNNRPPHLLYHDPFAPTRDNTGGAYVSELEGWGAIVNHTSRHRLISPSWYPVSTIGYAVSKRGAQKLLYNLGGYQGLTAPVDLAMIGLIQKGIVESYTIIPPMITRYKTGGSRDSDIDEAKPEDANGGTGSENLNSSARKALDALRRPHAR